MALTKQDAAKPHDASSTQTLPGPDYEAEAEERRLKLRGGELLRHSSRLNPQVRRPRFRRSRRSRFFVAGLVGASEVAE